MLSVSRICAALILSLALAPNGAMAAGAPVKMTDGVLTNDAGMTLYTFDGVRSGEARDGPPGFIAPTGELQHARRGLFPDKG